MFLYSCSCFAAVLSRCWLDGEREGFWGVFFFSYRVHAPNGRKDEWAIIEKYL